MASKKTSRPKPKKKARVIATAKKKPVRTPTARAGAASKPAAATAPARIPFAVNFFEIPAQDFDRAHNFYSALMGKTLGTREWRGVKMAFFDGMPSGAVVQGEGYVPSSQGSLIYLSAGADLAPVLARVEPAGGKILLPKTMLSPQLGWYALFLDSEGNRVALHSMS